MFSQTPDEIRLKQHYRMLASFADSDSFFYLSMISWIDYTSNFYNRTNDNFEGDL